MNRDDDLIAQLEDYLDTYEGVVPLPASVRNEVRSRLPETRQVRAAGVRERMLHMTASLSTTAKAGLGLAAAVVVFVMGAAALSSGGPTPDTGAAGRTAATAEPGSPGVAPSTSPSPEAIRLAAAPESSCGDGVGHWCLPAGTYRLSSDVWPGTISMTLPQGWFRFGHTSQSEAVLVESGQTVPGGSGWGVMFILPGEVYRDPCDPAVGRFPLEETATVDGLVGAISTWPGFEVSAPRSTEVDGWSGQVVEVTSTRTGSDCPVSAVWRTRAGSDIDGYPMVGIEGQPRAGTFRVVDVGGTLVVIRSTEFADPSPHELGQGVKPDPARHAADLAELQQIIDSIRISD